MTDAMTTEADHDTTAAEMPGGPPPGPRSIVPRDTIAGRALIAVIAIMTFLAALVPAMRAIRVDPVVALRDE